MQKQYNIHRSGFTLLELLIVIGILAVLAAVAVLVINPAEQIKNARIKSEQTKVNDLADTFIKIKVFSGKGLREITGSGCSDCPCRIATSTVDVIPACSTGWNNALNKIADVGTSTAAIGSLGAYAKDTWGGPYLLDENEGESGGCSRDIIRSAGPDRIHSTADDIYPHGVSAYIINVTPACTQ